MNTTFASHADGAAAGSDAGRAQHPVLVWDLPVRLAHWLMVASFTGAWLTAESERWRSLHVTLGTSLAALVAFRIVWGLVGTRHARFASFVRGPGAALRYLRSLLGGPPEHHVGHNPAGALAILALLGLGLAVTASGFATYQEIGGEWLEDLHEFAANAMLALVGLHIVAVAASSWLHRENLVAAMVTGSKNGRPQDGIRSAWRSVAALLVVAMIGLWAWQWPGAPAAGTGIDRPAATDRHDRHRRDHDD